MLRLAPHGAIAVDPMAREMTDATTSVKPCLNEAMPWLDLGPGPPIVTVTIAEPPNLPRAAQPWIQPGGDVSRCSNRGSSAKKCQRRRLVAQLRA